MSGAKRSLATIAVVVAVLADAAGAATTRLDKHGTTLVDGRKVFPIVLAKGPEPGATTPAREDALDAVVDAGVNFFKTGPSARPWWPQDIADAIAWNRAAAARGAYTWVNLATLSDAEPGGPKATRLREVVTALEGDASRTALAMWKGFDEPRRWNVPPFALQFAYCLGTSRGQPSWCADWPPADDEHLWVTIQAPLGTAAELARYTPVTDIHGVNHYPVTWRNAGNPKLHRIGTWTRRIASVTRSGAVWTTLQICASGAWDPSGSGRFVLPTRRQERYMIYDAIINGARSLAFYGGNVSRCWNARDRAHGWSWRFWETVLGPLVREIRAKSRIAPALLNPGTTKKLPSSDTTTQVISRQGANESELWVIAARHGAGPKRVTIRGLPARLKSGMVYTEGRSVKVRAGSLTDTFRRWDVHVYRFTLPASAPPPAPPPPAAAAARARCLVPNVKRKSLASARRARVRAGCTLGKVGAAYSSRVRKGRVIRRDAIFAGFSTSLGGACCPRR